MGFRINFLAYIDPFAWSGGGEAVTRALIDAGRRLGHDIRRTCVFPRPVDEGFDAPDFWFLADVHNVPERWWRRIPRSLLDRIVAHESYVHFDNAYVDICDLPYLPCNGDHAGDDCPFKRSRWVGGRGCFRRRTAEMYRRARLNLFVSPLHQRTVERMLGEETVRPAMAMRPLIDTDRFRNMHLDRRDIGALFVGHLNEAKGAGNLASQFPTGDLTIAGRVGDARYAGLGRQLGEVPYDELPALMNRAQVLVHLPRWPEPQGRTVAEGALCGCTLLTNDRVGATSFGLDLADPATYAGAVDEAWTAILAHVQ